MVAEFTFVQVVQMPDSLLQKPLGILGILGASIAGPYFFANKPSVPTQNAAGQSTPMQSGLNGMSSQSSLQTSDYTAGAASRYPFGNPSVGQLVSNQQFSSQPTVPVQSNVPWNPPISTANPTGNLAGNLTGTTTAFAVPSVITTSGPLYDFREVLRFDMTIQGLMQKFPRITTVLSETQLDGMRVPFVSGTMPTDVAGTLSYYFDRQQSLRRIQMHGTMGDPSMLISLMTQYYNLKPEQTLGGYLFTTRWNNRVTSVMQLNLAPIIDTANQLSRYNLFLELNQPSMEYAISAEAQQILATAQNAGRW